MKKLYILSENCNTWNSRNFEITSDFDIECSSCSSFDNFSFVCNYFIYRWEIDIPFDWKYGEWNRVRLHPVEIPILILKCNSCGEIYRVYPSFVLEGTTLTLSALIFISFAYESSNKLTWRDLPELFCEEHNRIAHSTLYKAVHGFGKGLKEYKDIVYEEKAKLISKYLFISEEKVENPVWSPQKSRYENTLERENALRIMLSPLVCLKIDSDSFPHLFFTYVRKFRTILSTLSPPVKKLYKK